MNARPPEVRAARPRPPLKATLFRLGRDWHGYLSAFAFLALIFFAATGLVLNHPEWTAGGGDRSAEVSAALPPAVVAKALAQPEPMRALAAELAERVPVVGGYASGEAFDGEAMLRFESPRGATDVVVDLASGRAEATVRRAGFLSLVNDLHRGKNAGPAWKALIDVVAALTLALSAVGYALFFLLRFRLRTGLALTGASLLLTAGLFVAFVP